MATPRISKSASRGTILGWLKVQKQGGHWLFTILKSFLKSLQQLKERISLSQLMDTIG